MATVARLKKNGDLSLVSQVNERLPAVHGTQKIEVMARGYSAGSGTYIKIDGVTRAGDSRGVTLVRLNEFGEYVDMAHYDTHTGTTNSDNLATAINDTPNGYYLIFKTQDQPVTYGTVSTHNASNLKVSLANLGFQKLEWNIRCAWTGIIRKGSLTPILEEYTAGDTSTTIASGSVVLSKGLVHYPLDGTAQPYSEGGYAQPKWRYIRDRLNGSTANTGNHWVEIQALDPNGNNIAVGKTVTASATGTNLTRITDGNTTTTLYGEVTGGSVQYVIIDLNAHYTLSEIKVWHYYADGRTYYGTKTEVSQDGVQWVTVFDSAVSGTYAETSSGRTHDVSRIGTGSLYHSSAALSDRGMNLEVTTTNLDSGSAPSIYNNPGVPATLTQLSETYMGQPIYRLGMTVTDAYSANLSHFQGSLASHGVRYNGRTFKANTKYAISLYWRPVNKMDTEVGGVASNIGGWNERYKRDMGDGWIRTVTTRDGTVTTDKTDSLFWSFRCPSLKLNETIYIDFCCHQIEEGRDFATSYIPSGTTRSGTGSMEFPVNTGADFTIFFKFVPSSNWFENMVSGNTNRNMFNLFDKNTGKKIWLNDYTGAVGVTTTDPWIGFDEFVPNTYSPWHWHHGGQERIAMKMGQEFWFALTKNGAVWTKHWCNQNGIYQAQPATHTNQALIDFSPSKLVFSGEFQWEIKDVSFYNRGLTADEIKKVAGSQFSLTPDGRLLTPSIKENVNSIPSDAIHIPLGLNGKSKNGLLIPSNETNIVYEGGAAWVGGTTTNVVTNTNLDTGWSKDYCTGIKWNDIPPPVGIDSPVVSFYDGNTDGSSYWYSYGDYAPQTPGAVYTVSMYVKTNDSNFQIKFYTADNSEVGRYSSEYRTVPNDGKWHRIVWNSFTNAANSVSQSLSFQFTFGSPQGEQQRTWFCAPQMENRTYPTPFVKGTRPYARLNYTGADITSNSWQEFSYVMRVKYSEASGWRISGAWNRWYLGVSGSNTLQFSWVEGGSQKTLYTAGGVVPVGTWVTLGVSVINNTSIRLFLDGNLMNSRGSGFQLNSTSMDFELNGISPTDSQYPLNAWVRDVVFVNRALTDQEMKNIAQIPMRQRGAAVTINGQLYEGQTL